MELDTLYSRKSAFEQTLPDDEVLADCTDTTSIQTVPRSTSSRVEVLSVAAQVPPLLYDRGNRNGAVPLTRRQRKLAHIQFMALCWTLFLNGWNDGSMGPLLPRIQRVYNVNFVIVSLIFVFACVVCIHCTAIAYRSHHLAGLYRRCSIQYFLDRQTWIWKGEH